MTDPDMGTWTYTYDLNGNMDTQTDARGVVITFVYDELNRLLEKNAPGNAERSLFTYDLGVNGIGLISQKQKLIFNDPNFDTISQTDYTSYDTMGRLLSETRTINTATVKFDYTWDLSGQPLNKTITKNNVVFEEVKNTYYPGTNLLQSVEDENDIAYSTITAYSPLGKMVSIQNKNNVITYYDYSYETGRINFINTYKMGVTIQDRAYIYSKAGDILEITDNVSGITYNYDYDHLHRLISEQSSGASVVPATEVEIIEFTYDDTTGKPVHAPASTEIDSVITEYYYTATGNRETKMTPAGLEASYISNYENMISQITANGVQTDFYYDADSKRVQKTQGTDTTLYFNETYEEINNTQTLYIFAGNLRIAKITGTDITYYQKDHLGSTTALTDESGNTIDSGGYLPYGLDKEVNALLQNSSYKFTDQEQDDGTGLYNYDARLYDPTLGQFVMADTIVPDLFNPQSLNRYAYCLNNPMKYRDPSGHYATQADAVDDDFDCDMGIDEKNWNSHDDDTFSDAVDAGNGKSLVTRNQKVRGFFGGKINKATLIGIDPNNVNNNFSRSFLSLDKVSVGTAVSVLVKNTYGALTDGRLVKGTIKGFFMAGYVVFDTANNLTLKYALPFKLGTKYKFFRTVAVNSKYGAKVARAKRIGVSARDVALSLAFYQKKAERMGTVLSAIANFNI